jgi:glycosyltransferase involved in cell wall biosynthesis
VDYRALAMSSVLLAIPVFNEAKHLVPVLARARRHVDDILVIDDGSTDDTPRLLAGQSGVFRLTHSENRGYGQSLIDAFRFAARHGFDWVITMDCDEQHEPSFIPRFLDAIAAGDADVVSGSRYLAAFPENTSPPTERRRINAAITRLLREVLGLELTDAFCGFKAHRVSSMADLRLTVPGYAFPLQLWVQAARAGLRVREIPVPLIYHDSNRHFGGSLDDPVARLRHYLEVFVQELRDGCEAAAPVALRGAQECEPCKQR